MSIKITCIIIDDEPVAREIVASFVAKISNLELIKTCQNAMEAFDIMNTQHIDLLFLDINMPDVSGLTLAKSTNKNSKIIFTTAYREYAIDGFDLQAVDYLLKPIPFERFLQAVNKYFETRTPVFKETKTPVDTIKNDFMFVRSDRKMVKIDFNAILYIESLGDYINIITINSKITTRETISNIEAKLPSDKFIRVHRSYIVSLNEISSYTNEFIEMHEKAIPISRSYKESVLHKLT